MTAVTEARRIMGPNFFGPEDAVRHLKLPPARPSRKISHVPFSRELLKKHASTHTLVWVSSVSILTLMSVFEKYFEPIEVKGKKIFFVELDDDFAKESGKSGWFLVKNGQGDTSGGMLKGLDLSCHILATGRNAKLPLRPLLYSMLGMRLKTGDWKIWRAGYIGVPDESRAIDNLLTGGRSTGAAEGLMCTVDRNRILISYWSMSVPF